MKIYITSVISLPLVNFQKIFSNYLIKNCCCLYCAKYLAEHDLEKYIECMGFGYKLPKISPITVGVPTIIPQTGIITLITEVPYATLLGISFNNGVYVS
ncbi:MAG TPA: hypothetical protein ENO40_07090 [Desulfurella acetivorans]|nr:hypothetical protein [Desulfurella acetivorans]